MFLATFGEDGDVGTVGGLRDLDAAVAQFGERPQRLRAILQRQPGRAGPLLRGKAPPSCLLTSASAEA